MDKTLKLARAQRKEADRKQAADFLFALASQPAVQCLAVVAGMDFLAKQKVVDPAKAKGLAGLFTGVTVATHGGGAAGASLAALIGSGSTGNNVPLPPGTSWWDKMIKYDKWPWEN